MKPQETDITTKFIFISFTLTD